MTKFGKAGKMGHPVSYSGLSSFLTVSKQKQGAKLEDLKIQCVLKHEKG
jgi:hypothetical protein